MKKVAAIIGSYALVLIGLAVLGYYTVPRYREDRSGWFAYLVLALPYWGGMLRAWAKELK